MWQAFFKALHMVPEVSTEGGTIDMKCTVSCFGQMRKLRHKKLKGPAQSYTDLWELSLTMGLGALTPEYLLLRGLWPH